MSTNDTLTIRGNITEQGNLTIGAAVNANGSFGLPGMALISAGPSANAYWGAANATSNAGGPNSSIQYNFNGVFEGDANLEWQSGNATLVISNSISTQHISVNNSLGSAGYSLISGGASGNAYWGLVNTSAAPGSNTQLIFNNSGVYAGDANLTWNTANATLSIGNSTVNAQLTSFSLSILGNSTNTFNLNYNGNTKPTNGGLAGLILTNQNQTNTAQGGILFQLNDDGGTPRHGAAIVAGRVRDWVGGSTNYPGFLEFWARQDGGGGEALVMHLQGNSSSNGSNGGIAVTVGANDNTLGNTVDSNFTIVSTSPTAFAIGSNTTLPGFAINVTNTGSWTMYDYGSNSWNASIFANAGSVYISSGKLVAQSGFTSWFGTATSVNYGLVAYSNSNFAVYGISNTNGGVYGQSNSSTGAQGVSNTGWGVYGQSSTNWSGVFEPGNTALSGGGSFSESSGTWNALQSHALGSGYGAYIQANTGWILALANNGTETLHVYNDGTVNTVTSIISTGTGSGGQFRAVGGNYGFMLRNDGATFYHLITNSGDPYGNWNSLRPYQVALNSGFVTIDGTGAGTTFGGNITVNGGTVTASRLAGTADAATNSSNSNHLFISGGGAASNWNWSGQGGQPAWLWGSNDGTNMYVWNPSNFNVNNATYCAGWTPSYSGAQNGYMVLPGNIKIMWNYQSSPIFSTNTWVLPIGVSTILSVSIVPVVIGSAGSPRVTAVNTSAIVWGLATNSTSFTSSTCYLQAIGI